MDTSHKRVVVLGGGIRGSAIAALLARLGHHVTLFERQRVAAGATATNHGRIHIGTNTWLNPNKSAVVDQITQRRNAGARLLLSIPGVVYPGHSPGLHVVDKDAPPSFPAQLEEFCRNYGIGCKKVVNSGLSGDWIDDARYQAIYEVDEYSFNPAELASRLIHYAECKSASISINQSVEGIEDRKGKLVVSHTGGETETDVVINALGSWLNDPRSSSLRLPRVELRLDRLTLLVLKVGDQVPALKRVITVIDEADSMTSALPHPGWIVLGSGAKAPDRLAQGDSYPTVEVLQYDPQAADAFQKHQLTSVRKHFLPLVNLDPAAYVSRLYYFHGILPREVDEKGNIVKDSAQWHTDFRIIPTDIQGYYPIIGGNATTALLDAVDVVAKVTGVAKDRVLENEKEICKNLSPARATISARGMVWEDSGGI